MRVGIAVGTLLAVGCLCSTADAADVAVELQEYPDRGGTSSFASIEFRGGVGERNDVTVSQEGDTYVLRDAGAPLRPGAGCEAVAPGVARCRLPQYWLSGVAIRLGDGDDRAVSDASTTAAGVWLYGDAGSDRLELVGSAAHGAVGGDGDDELIGGAAMNDLRGGEGADTLLGGGGDDELDGGPGANGIDGGDGIDRLDYGDRRTPVIVDLLEGHGGGVAEEGDTIAGVEAVSGGHGDDRISGTEGADRLSGQQGNDILVGRGGADVLGPYLLGPANESGDDQLSGGDGDDRLDGGEGDDTLLGGPGADTLEGGSGGENALHGGSGDDRLTPDWDFKVRDFVSTWSCGQGRDTVVLQHRRRMTLTSGCERIEANSLLFSRAPLEPRTVSARFLTDPGTCRAVVTAPGRKAQTLRGRATYTLRVPRADRFRHLTLAPVRPCRYFWHPVTLRVQVAQVDGRQRHGGG